MADKTSIGWAESTWNPVTGCTKVSPGCKNCFAEKLALRLKAMGRPRYANGFMIAMQPDLLDLPLRWKRPRKVFVNSMSDLFHKDVPTEFIQQVFATMRKAARHTFQLLTRRTERLLEMDAEIDWPANVWMGVSVENADYQHRIDHLRRTGAKVKFLAMEPLLGPLPGLDLSGIDWAITGGESGPGARPMASEWAADIRDQCVASGVPFYFEQWGGTSKRKAGRLLDGRTWDEMPGARRVALPVVA